MFNENNLIFQIHNFKVDEYFIRSEKNRFKLKYNLIPEADASVD